MVARAPLAALAIACSFILTTAQPTALWVDVASESPEESNTEDPEEVEKRYTPELIEELKSAKADALLLYTEYTARAAVDMKRFLMNVTGLYNETLTTMVADVWDSASEPCRSAFKKRLLQIQYDAQKAASFSSENHHKFYLGHMIVFRMHLNKSEDYIKKCDKVIRSCGIRCETTPKIMRWRRLALAEIHRVRDDLQHSRKAYKDLLAHAHRRLNTLRKRAKERAKIAVEDLRHCTDAG